MEDSSDDEETVEKEEKMQQDVNHEDEIKKLEEEGMISLIFSSLMALAKKDSYRVMYIPRIGVYLYDGWSCAR